MFNWNKKPAEQPCVYGRFSLIQVCLPHVTSAIDTLGLHLSSFRWIGTYIIDSRNADA